LEKYRDFFPRKTQFQAIEQIDIREVSTKAIRVGFDPVSGFIGTKVTGEHVFECTNYDKLLLLYKDGTYSVISLPEKQYVHQDGNKVVYAGIADKKTVITALYKDPKTHLCYVKRFVISAFILEKIYRYFEEGMDLLYISTRPEFSFELQLIPKPNQKVKKVVLKNTDFLVKGVSAKGVRTSNRQVKKISIQSDKGV
jgi:topoisomerase-4 subunit A